MKEKTVRTGAGAQAQPSPSFEQFVPTRILSISVVLEEVARLMLGEIPDISFTETRILAYLSERKCASVSDISRDLRVDKAWVSRLLQALCGKQLIVKERDPSDSRAILASLTDAGQEHTDKSMAVALQTYDTIMEGIDERIAKEMIARMDSNLRDILARIR